MSKGSRCKEHIERAYELGANEHELLGNRPQKLSHRHEVMKGACETLFELAHRDGIRIHDLPPMRELAYLAFH